MATENTLVDRQKFGFNYKQQHKGYFFRNDRTVCPDCFRGHTNLYVVKTGRTVLYSMSIKKLKQQSLSTAPPETFICMHVPDNAGEPNLILKCFHCN